MKYRILHQEILLPKDTLGERSLKPIAWPSQLLY